MHKTVFHLFVSQEEAWPRDTGGCQVPPMHVFSSSSFSWVCGEAIGHLCVQLPLQTLPGTELSQQLCTTGTGVGGWGGASNTLSRAPFPGPILPLHSPVQILSCAVRFWPYELEMDGTSGPKQPGEIRERLTVRAPSSWTDLCCQLRSREGKRRGLLKWTAEPSILFAQGNHLPLGSPPAGHLAGLQPPMRVPCSS